MSLKDFISLFAVGVGGLVLITKKCPIFLGPLLIAVGGYLWWMEHESHEERGKETLGVTQLPWYVWAIVGGIAFAVLMWVISLLWIFRDDGLSQPLVVEQNNLPRKPIASRRFRTNSPEETLLAWKISKNLQKQGIEPSKAWLEAYRISAPYVH
jgi:hypothetical protein